MTIILDSILHAMPPSRSTNTPSPARRRRVLLQLGVAAGLVAAVLLLRPSGAADDEPPADQPSLAPPVVAPAGPEQFCAGFRAVAAAHAQHLAAPSDRTSVALVDEAGALVDLGVPAGLSDAGYAALASLVDGVLQSVDTSEGLRAELQDAQDAVDAGPDQAALDRYLSDVCPA